MSDLATTHLRQARGFLRAGDTPRAVELLERARLLARDNRTLLRVVLEELSSAYAATGQHDKAGRCQDQLYALGPAPSAPPAASSGFGPMSTASAPAFALPMPTPAQRSIGIVISATVVVMLLLGTGAVIWWRLAQPPATTTAASTPPPAAASAKPPAPASGPATQAAVIASAQTPVAPRPPIVIPPIPILPSAPARPPAAPALPGSAEQIRKDAIGLVIMLVHYEGPHNGRRVSVDWPMGNGTAFAIESSGFMLTNRHVIEGPKNNSDIPATLQHLGMPTVTRRRTDFVVCFGANPADHHRATIVHTSTKFDMALLKVGRTFNNPLRFARAQARQGDDVQVCGFPGIIIDVLNSTNKDPVREKQIGDQARQTGSINLLHTYSPDAFNNTLNRGIVSAAERNIENASYLQVDATINPGNSGGPVMNLQNEVLGIVTLKVGQKAGIFDKYGFALLPAQFKDELAPYVKID